MRRILLAGLILGLSCGADDGDEPVDMSPQGVCALYADKHCDGMARCHEPLFDFEYHDAALCRERWALGCKIRLTAPGTSETPARVASCAKAIAALPCERFVDFQHWPEPCAQAPGTLPDDATCIVSGQCQGGYCLVGGGQACGACRTVSPEGGPCQTYQDCLGLIECVHGVCKRTANIGETCEPDAHSCNDGLTCRNVDASGIGTCGKLLEPGAPCIPDPFGGADECDYLHFYRCDASTKTCKLSMDRIPPVGGICSADICTNAGFCDDQSVCRMKPREGESCRNPPGCLSPARCIGGVCRIRDATMCQ